MRQKERHEKIERVRAYMEQHAYTGMVLARQDNFSWISAGGSNRVVVPREQGYGVVTITKDHIYMTAQVMDGQRIMEEELEGSGFEYVPLRWYEQPVLDRALTLAGDKPVCDVAAPGAECKERHIYDLHFPLMPDEIERMKIAGELSDRILHKVAGQIRPDMIDSEVEAMLLYEYALHNMQCDVLLIGTEQRISKYRHPLPVGEKLGKYVFLHPAVRYRGLHCNVTRTIYFGDELPKDIQRAYDAVSYIEAYCMAQCEKHASWIDILNGQKKLLEQFGFADEWQNHYPGGRTGYFVCQADLALHASRRTMQNEAYDWFITVTGAKVEELSVNCEDGIHIFSNTGLWPSKQIEIEDRSFSIPQIMMR